jgi:hypothetical protein
MITDRVRIGTEEVRIVAEGVENHHEQLLNGTKKRRLVMRVKSERKISEP